MLEVFTALSIILKLICKVVWWLCLHFPQDMRLLQILLKCPSWDTQSKLLFPWRYSFVMMFGLGRLLAFIQRLTLETGKTFFVASCVTLFGVLHLLVSKFINSRHLQQRCLVSVLVKLCFPFDISDIPLSVAWIFPKLFRQDFYSMFHEMHNVTEVWFALLVLINITFNASQSLPRLKRKFEIISLKSADVSSSFMSCNLDISCLYLHSNKAFS